MIPDFSFDLFAFCSSSLNSLQEAIELSEESICINAMDHTGLIHGLSAGGGSAKAVHADCVKQRLDLRCEVQNVTDDGFFLNGNHFVYSLLIFLSVLYPEKEKNTRGF